MSATPIVDFLNFLRYKDLEMIELVYLLRGLKWSIVACVPERTGSNAIINGIHHVFDVHILATVRMYEDAATRLLEEYKNATDASSIVSITDTKGVIIYVNDIFCEISGYSREELIGRSHNVIRHPDMPSAAFADLWQTIQSKQVWK